MTTAALVLAALHHCREPAMASAVADAATGLAVAADWPKSACKVTPQNAAAFLRGLEKNGEVKRNGTERQDGCDRPKWEPVRGFRPDVPTPEYDGEERSPLPIDSLSRPQQVALFSVLDTSLVEYQTQREEFQQLMQQHDRRMRSMVERLRAQLLAVGLDPP